MSSHLLSQRMSCWTQRVDKLVALGIFRQNRVTIASVSSRDKRLYYLGARSRHERLHYWCYWIRAGWTNGEIGVKYGQTSDPRVFAGEDIIGSETQVAKAAAMGIRDHDRHRNHSQCLTLYLQFAARARKGIQGSCICQAYTEYHWHYTMIAQTSYEIGASIITAVNTVRVGCV